MKHKLKRILVLSVFSVLFFSGIFYSIETKANESPGGANKLVKNTICCKNCIWVGTSNDCVDGQGSCVDHFCSAGETEETSGCTMQ